MGHKFRVVLAYLQNACGLTFEGDIYCWGNNDLTQLGNGTTDDSVTPVRVLAPSAARQSFVRSAASRRFALRRVSAR
jgi:alpha-tubulin suppressor-like RCC1 family protein